MVRISLTRLEVGGSIHELKSRMLDLQYAVVAMLGGLGTLEEFSQALTWAQLGF